MKEKQGYRAHGSKSKIKGRDKIMAMYHLHIETGSRSSGHSATAKDEYIERNGSYAYKHKDILLAESRNMPAWADEKAAEYWRAADVYERVNGRLYVEVEFSLPVELSQDERTTLARDFAERLTSEENLPYTLAIHRNDPNNPHCHLMISERMNDMIDRSPDTWFRKADAKESPGARKTRNLKRPEWLRDTRKLWANVANAALEKAGYDERIDHRTLEAQGIDRIPQIHVGACANAIDGSSRKKRNEEIKRLNAEREMIERESAELGSRYAEIDRRLSTQAPAASPKPPEAAVQERYKPALSLEDARAALDGEQRALEAAHEKRWERYLNAVEKYKEQTTAAPEAPFLPWKKKQYEAEREAWRTALNKSWDAYIEAVEDLGISAADPSSIAEEAMTIHKNYKAAAAMEARTNRPDAAEAIKWHEAEEAARKKRNEEIWEARVKIARGLVRDPDATVSSTFGQHTRGILYGLFEHEGQHIAVQRSTKGHVYLHRVPSENVAKLERLIGKEIYMSSRLGKFSVEVSERAAKNRSRGIGR